MDTIEERRAAARAMLHMAQIEVDHEHGDLPYRMRHIKPGPPPSPKRLRRGMSGYGYVQTGATRVPTTIFIALVSAVVGAAMSIAALNARYLERLSEARVERQDAMSRLAVLQERHSSLQSRLDAAMAVVNDIAAEEAQILDFYTKALESERWFDAATLLYEAGLRLDRTKRPPGELAADYQEMVDLLVSHAAARRDDHALSP
jgi:hypothetical protein